MFTLKWTLMTSRAWWWSQTLRKGLCFIGFYFKWLIQDAHVFNLHFKKDRPHHSTWRMCQHLKMLWFRAFGVFWINHFTLLPFQLFVLERACFASPDHFLTNLEAPWTGTCIIKSSWCPQANSTCSSFELRSNFVFAAFYSASPLK